MILIRNARMVKMRKKGLVGKSITNILLWIVFLILALVAVGFLIKKLTA